MKVTISQYKHLERDSMSSVVPSFPLTAENSNSYAADNNVTLDSDTRIVRVYTDTKIYVDTAATDTDSPVMPANSVEGFTVSGGETLYFTTVA